MLKKLVNNNKPNKFKGFSLITQSNLANNIKKYIGNLLFYLVLLALVVKVLSLLDVNPLTYSFHLPGAILCRLLYLLLNLSLENLKVILPRNSSLINIPVVGLIVLCSRHPSYLVDVNLGMIFDQYYYFDILNILNSKNNNSIPGVSYTNLKVLLNLNILGKLFIVDTLIKMTPYKLGDVILSGRYGNFIKLTYENINKKYNSLIIISNGLSTVTLVDYKLNLDYTLSSSSNLNSLGSLKGNNIILLSDRVIINSKTKNTLIFSKKDLVASSNLNVFIDSKKVQINAKLITIMVGDNKVIVNNSGVTIDATNILLNGKTSINGILNGVTPGFCSIPVCPFTGAPHTTNVVGVPK